MPRGGARANSGGARAGAGRKATRPGAHRLAVLLSTEEYALLDALQARLGVASASEVLRRGLVALADQLPANEPAAAGPRKRVVA